MNRVSAGEQQQQQTAEQLQSKQQHADVQRFEKDDTAGDNDKARCRKTAGVQHPAGKGHHPVRLHPQRQSRWESQGTSCIKPDSMPPDPSPAKQADLEREDGQTHAPYRADEPEP